MTTLSQVDPKPLPRRVLRKLRGAVSFAAGALRHLWFVCGFDSYHDSEDRRVLETVIMPDLAGREEVRRVLFVGCAWCTRGYWRIFRRQEYVTLEVDPGAAKFGARRHVVDSLENVRRHFGEGELDVIICNGVFGWGLDDRGVVERAFEGCFECLRVGGIFVLGWNDVPENRPFPPSECRSLRRFAPYEFAPLRASRHATATGNRHTFWFFRKEEGEEGGRTPASPAAGVPGDVSRGDPNTPSHE